MTPVGNGDGVTISREEIMRVLAPGGVFCSGVARSGSARLRIARKPWPQEIDQWTHFLHSAAGNAVAADQRVAPATALQWIVEPKYCRSHEIDSSLPAMVSADGRLFYILDEGPIGITDPRFPARWVLIARDAFNGRVPLETTASALGLAAVETGNPRAPIGARSEANAADFPPKCRGVWLPWETAST